MEPIYLDANASTPLDPAVRDAMLPYLGEHFGNATSGHARGRVLREAVERARGQLAEFLGCEPDEIVFTSGGSESNNLALKGAASAYRARRGTHLLVSAVEHPSVQEVARFLGSSGWAVSEVGVDRAGVVDLPALDLALTPQTAVVSVILAQNETGVLQPVADIVRRARAAGVPVVHTDAAQAAGKIPVRVADLGIDLLTLAAHKFYGPWGVGALFVRRGVVPEPQIHGAGHERGLRSGTPNAAAIVGFGAAAALASRRVAGDMARLRALSERLLARLQAAGDVVLHGDPDRRLPNTLNVGFAGVHGADILERVPEVQCSTGSACHSGSRELSGVLGAMGVDPATGLGALRLSLCRTSTEAEVDAAAALLVEAVRSLRAARRRPAVPRGGPRRPPGTT